MGDIAGSTKRIKLGDSFYVVLGDNWLAHFQDCTVQAAPEDILKLYTVLGSRARSLRSRSG